MDENLDSKFEATALCHLDLDIARLLGPTVLVVGKMVILLRFPNFTRQTKV